MLSSARMERVNPRYERRGRPLFSRGRPNHDQRSRPLSLSGPSEARARGIGMVHQHFKLVMPFTVAENILLANGGSAYRSGIKEMRAAIKRQSAELGFVLDPDSRVNTLNVAQQQQVEIVKVLVAGAKILILDEPTAVLTDAEAEQLLEPVRGLRGPARPSS